MGRRLQAKINRVGTALGNKAAVPRRADFLFGIIAEPRARTIKPHAIWTDQRDFRVEREIAKLCFESYSKFFRRFRKSRSKKSDRADSIRDAVLQDPRRYLPRNRTDRVIDRLSNLRQA